MNSPPDLVTCYAGCGQQYDARDRAACRYHQLHGDATGLNLARMGRRRRRLAAMVKDRRRLLDLLDRLQADRDAAVRGWHREAGSPAPGVTPAHFTITDYPITDQAFLNLWRPDR